MMAINFDGKIYLGYTKLFTGHFLVICNSLQCSKCSVVSVKCSEDITPHWINRFRCHEVKTEESKKMGIHWELNVIHLA